MRYHIVFKSSFRKRISGERHLMADADDVKGLTGERESNPSYLRPIAVPFLTRELSCEA